MRDFLGKLAAGSILGGAALLVSACGSGNEANNTSQNNLGNNVAAANTSDPMAVEMNNVGSTAPANGTGGPASGAPPAPSADDTADDGGTDAGGDTGGNSADEENDTPGL